MQQQIFYEIMTNDAEIRIFLLWFLKDNVQNERFFQL